MFDAFLSHLDRFKPNLLASGLAGGDISPRAGQTTSARNRCSGFSRAKAGRTGRNSTEGRGGGGGKAETAAAAAVSSSCGAMAVSVLGNFLMVLMLLATAAAVVNRRPTRGRTDSKPHAINQRITGVHPTLVRIVPEPWHYLFPPFASLFHLAI